MDFDGEDDIHRTNGEIWGDYPVNGAESHSECHEKAIRTPGDCNAVNGGRLFPLCGLGARTSA